MADVRHALAETVSITASGKAPSNRPSKSKNRIGWLFVCSDIFAVFLGLNAAPLLMGLLGPSIGLAAAPGTDLFAAAVLGPQQFAISATLAIAAATCFWLGGHYERHQGPWDTLADVTLIGGLLVTLHLVATQVLIPTGSIVAGLLGWALAALLLLSGRRTVRRCLIEDGAWFQPAVIVGQKDRALKLADAIAADADLALDVTHLVQTDERLPGEPAIGESDEGRIEIVRSDDVLAELIFRFRGHAILFCPAPEQYETIGRLVQSVGAMGSRAAINFPFPGFVPSGGRSQSALADGTTLIWVRNRLSHPLWRAAKRCIDIVGSAALLVALSPAFLAIAVPSLVRKEAVFFGHRRIGLHGRPFTCFKFRTMVSNSAEILQALLASDENARLEWEASYKLKDDPRITPFGGLLRRTSLDELPQLWNVLKGDMSLVGPRPVVEGELSLYGEDVLTYISVKPGITGLWQVSGRSDACYDKRVAFDRWYVRHWSLRSDLVILFKTVRVVLTRAGAY